MACHCSGDIEDHDTGEEYTLDCTCCMGKEFVPDDDDGPDIPAGNITEDEDRSPEPFPHTSDRETTS